MKGPGGLAQLGEHLLCKQGVVGSIPSSSTNPQCITFWEEQSDYALAIEPVRGRVNRVHVVLSFFNNLEEVVKRFTKAHLEMGERVGESRVVIVSMYEKLSRDGLEYGATRILNLWRL
jgi:hypothetical protein